MKILLADSQRDLLQSYEKLLTMDGHAVTSAFDGVQVASLLEREAYDLAILEEGLPRLGDAQLLPLLREKRVPCVMLLSGRATVRHLLRPQLPQAYLAFPFLPADLRGLIAAVYKRAQSAETPDFGGVLVDEAGFCFAGSHVSLTEGEIALLSSLAKGETVGGKRARTLILALNEKLNALGSPARILYEIQKGYRLVNGHE